MKTYKFDYLREWVDEWNDKTHVTRQMLNMLPWDITFCGIPQYDHYGDTIEDHNDWYSQRNAFLDKLWEELGKYEEIW